MCQLGVNGCRQIGPRWKAFSDIMKLMKPPTIYRSFSYAWSGLLTVWREERNFRIETFAAALALGSSFLLGFSILETAMVVIAIVLVLSAEIINTAVEDLCNKVEPAEDPHIGKIKDMMAAFVCVSVIGAVALGGLAFGSYIGIWG